MKRVVILGRGGAGKTTLAQALSTRLHIAPTNLSSLFHKHNASSITQWRSQQEKLIAKKYWIIDGDLGPNDPDLALRLAAADTIVVLDYPFGLCAWRAFRQGKKTGEYWRSMMSYRFRYLPKIKRLIHQHGNHASIHYIHSPWGIPELLNSTVTQPN